jgi:hypothetical protein
LPPPPEKVNFRHCPSLYIIIIITHQISSFICSYSLLLRFVDDTFDPDLGATIGKVHELRPVLINMLVPTLQVKLISVENVQVAKSIIF